MTDIIAFAPRILAAAVIGLGLLILAVQAAPARKQEEGEGNRSAPSDRGLTKPPSPDSGRKATLPYETPTIGE